jgi:hypothetical protein
MYSRLTLNSQFFCLSLLSAGITGVHHHTLLEMVSLKTKEFVVSYNQRIQALQGLQENSVSLPSFPQFCFPLGRLGHMLALGPYLGIILRASDPH